MIVPLSKKLLSVFLACALFSPTLPAQASESSDSTTITLEKTVQFEDLQGEKVLVAPGTYSVEAGEKEALRLIAKDSTTPVTIQADQGSYKANMPVATAASISGQEGVLANTHLVILFYPDGHTLQAIGTYPGLQSRGISDAEERSGTQEPDDPTTIILEKRVHFLATDGSDVVAEPGNYSVESAQEWLRLIPGHARQNALLIEAKTDTHDVDLEIPMAMAIPGGTLQELNLLNVQLLLPGGNSLEAQGTYDGIRPRSWLSKAAAQAKARARAAALKAQKARAAAQARAKAIALAAKRAAENAARAAAAKAKEIAAKTAQFAKVQVCKINVGVIKGSIKGGEAIGSLMKHVKGILPVAKQRQGSTQKKLNQDPAFHERIMHTMISGINNNKYVLPEMTRIQANLNNPANRSKFMDSLFSPKLICENPIPQLDKTLIQLGLAPSFATVRTRSATDDHFYMGFQVTLDAAYVGGAQIGIFGVTDFRGNGGWYWFIGPEAGIVVGAGGNIEAIFFPKVDLDSFAGWGSGIGGSLGAGFTGNVDGMWDGSVKSFQGFGIGGGGGVGSKMVGSLAVSYTHAWRLGK